MHNIHAIKWYKCGVTLSLIVTPSLAPYTDMLGPHYPKTLNHLP